MRQKNWLWLRRRTIKLQEVRISLEDKFRQTEDETPVNTSLVILSHVLQRAKGWILAHGDYQLTEDEDNTLKRLVDRLQQGFPLPYALGSWEFYGRMFLVTPDVMIPRPETELLVEKAIAFAQNITAPHIVDVGTGSGVIAISLAVEFPSALIIASDISKEALWIAKKNASLHRQMQIHFVQADLVTPFWQEMDIICANLPYIPSRVLDTLDVSRWEPRLALDGGENGLEPIETLLRQAQSRLAFPGMILLEIEANLGAKSLALAKVIFPRAKHTLHRDLAGRDRILEIRQVPM